MSAFGLRPSQSLDAFEQIYQATTLIGFGTDPPRFFGTAFFVANVAGMNPYLVDNSAVAFLVTARHVVAPALSNGRSLCVRINRFSSEPTVLTLPGDGWSFPNDEADLAILPLPNLKSDLQVGGIAVAVISPEQFFIEDWRVSPYDYRLGDAVRIVGTWYGATRFPQLIVRSGNIATATIGPVQFETGAYPAYLADVTVTRAMSGGPAYATHGRGWAETAIIGINSGYWPVTPIEADDPKALVASADHETADERALRRLSCQVERLNSRLAIVTPIHRLGQMLQDHPLWSG